MTKLKSLCALAGLVISLSAETSEFSLGESMEDVARKLGPPKLVADFGAGLRSWQYHLGSGDNHDPSHYLVFRRSSGKLVSVTRNYDPEELVDGLFPGSQTSTHFLRPPTDPPYGVRVRRLPGGRVLLAMGSPKTGQPVSQLVLMLEADLASLYPWLADALKGNVPPPEALR